MFSTARSTRRRNAVPRLLHPNKLGYEKWKAALKPILARLDLGSKKAE